MNKLKGARVISDLEEKPNCMRLGEN